GLLAAVSGADDDKPPDVSKLPPAAKGVMDFRRDIRPIFEARCLRCHGPEKQKSGLRLDSGAAALKGGDSGAVIVPGKSAASRLIHLVGGLEEDTPMPPTGKRLSAAEVGKLRAWIDQGAKWPKEKEAGPAQPRSRHWAFQLPKGMVPPQVARGGWT